jgi:single-strand DNA-binding protein
MEGIIMNSVFLIGNLTADPKPFAENKGVNFTIAYNRKFAAKDGKVKEEVSYFDCVSFRNVEIILKYLKKGSKAGVSGSLKQERWEQNGESRSKVVVMVNGLDFLTPKDKAAKDDAPESVSDEMSDW